MNSPVSGLDKHIPFTDSPGQKKASDRTEAPGTEASQALRPQKLRRRMIKLSAIIIIIVPTLLAGLYYGLVASDQYAVEFRFSVRGISSGAGGDLLSMVTGIPSGGSPATDSYILMDYIRSREIIEKLHKLVNLNEIYGPQKADFLSVFDPEEPIEEFIEYWKKMITLSYASSSQIIVVEVRAFTPQDARLVAEKILELSEQLVNELSAKARRDAVGHAEKELTRMEKRLRKARQDVRLFREREKVIDPSKTADSKLGILAQLEVQLATETAKLSSLIEFMDKGSPRIRVLVGKINALKQQIKAQRARLGRGKGTDGDALASLLEQYRFLLTQQEFAEKAYASALTSLETARLEAGRQQRYLATFVPPSLPQSALYPKRLRNFLLTFVISVMIWAIGTLVVYAVRDHAM